MSKPYKRRQKFVDRQVQGSIALRTTTYWALCVLTLASMLFVWRIVVEPPRPFYGHLQAMWHQYGPVAIASVLLLPILITDVIAMSNRFAGPALRLRQSIRQLADGEPVAPLRFRKNDFWRDFADDFNRLRARVQPLVDVGASLLDADEADEQVAVVRPARPTAPLWVATGAPDAADSSAVEPESVR